MKESLRESKTRSGDLKDVYGSNWTKQRSFRIHTPMNHYPKTSLPTKQRAENVIMNHKRKNVKTSTPTKNKQVNNQNLIEDSNAMNNFQFYSNMMKDFQD